MKNTEITTRLTIVEEEIFDTLDELSNSTKRGPNESITYFAGKLVGLNNERKFLKGCLRSLNNTYFAINIFSGAKWMYALNTKFMDIDTATEEAIKYVNEHPELTYEIVEKKGE